MKSDHLEAAKTIGDAVIIPAGVVVSASYWLTEIISPLVTILVGLMTIIWIGFRIRESKKNGDSK